MHASSAKTNIKESQSSVDPHLFPRGDSCLPACSRDQRPYILQLIRDKNVLSRKVFPGQTKQWPLFREQSKRRLMRGRQGAIMSVHFHAFKSFSSV